MIGGGKPGALACPSAPCAQAAHSGLWISPGKGLGSFGACASALVRVEGRLGQGEWLVGQPDMDEEADEYESNHQELVQQLVRHHNDEVLFHGDERGSFYRIRPLLNYPLHSHTRPPPNAYRAAGSCSDQR